MTNAQQMALCEAFLLLEQHFDYSLLVVGMKERSGVHVQPDEEVCWSGGWLTAHNLCDEAQRKIQFRKRMTRSPPNVTTAIMNECMEKLKP